jgi:hypothetical protein
MFGLDYSNKLLSKVYNLTKKTYLKMLLAKGSDPIADVY